MKNINFGDIPIGLYDIPYSPKETVLYLNMMKSNAVIFGRAMSGKTVMVKNILARMNELSPYSGIEHTYILDFGGNLSDYSGLGRVAACFDSSNEENIKRLFNAVEARLSDNSRRLNGVNYLEYQTENANDLIDHVTLIIENVTAFLAEERYADYHERLARIVRDGVSKGISVLLTANDHTSSLARLMVYFDRKFALEMPMEKYLEIFNMRVDTPMKIPGRGVTVIDSKPCEFQAYLPFKTEGEVKALIASTSAFGIEKLRSFPQELTFDNYNEYCTDINLTAGEILVGLDYSEQNPVTVDFDDVRNIAIYGKKQFGKTNLLRLLLHGVLREYPGANYMFFDDMRGQLKEFYDYASNHTSGSVTYITQLNVLMDEVIRIKDGRSMGTTFMILQNKILFREDPTNREQFVLASLMLQAREAGLYFIFTDVPRIPSNHRAGDFNQFIEVAFLLDSIGDFLMNKGQSSVFSGLDVKEMQREYTRSDIGDGFYYDIALDEFKKIKVIKTEV